MLKTIREVREIGWNVLVKHLGVSGATLFMLEHEEGYGNYTEERKKIFNKKSLKNILDEIKKQKLNGKIK